MRNALTTLILMLSLSASLFGATSVGTLTWDSSTLQLKQPSGFFDSNAVKIGYALNGSNKITAESIGARPSYTLGGYTNRLTWQGIVVDSRPIVQAAIDDVYARGGGVVELGPGDWRFGNDTNAGTLYMKPRVALIGTGKPMSDDSYEGTYSATNVIRISHSTMLHFAGGSTNGYGAPCIALVGTPYYTNQYYQAFADALGEWVAYYRGGNVIANLGIWSGWKWAWNSSNAPAAAIYINEVAGTTIDNVFIGPTAGPGIYIRGGFGTRIYDSYIVNSIAGGVVVADTSDTWIDRTSIPSPNGSSVAYVGSTRTNGTFVQTANTHKLVNVAFWNNREELSGWVGTSTTYTNGGIVESVGVRRTGYTADASTDSIGIALRVGSDTGLPVMVRGTSLPGGLNTNTVYFVRWGTQGGTNLQLCLTSGRAINGGAAVDITSSGGSDTWWLESPSAFVFGSDAQEIQIEGARMDQSWSTIVELRRSQRSKISGIHAFEVGLNQTEIRQSRKQTFFEPTIAAFKFVDCSDISLTDNQIIGSKGNTGLSNPWIHNPVGVSIVRGQDFVISGNLFDRLNTAILIDSESGNISTDGNAIGGWVARPLDSGSTYGIAPHTPYFDGKTNSQIVATIPTAFTNISAGADWAVAMKARVPTMVSNGWPNGRHSALFNLTWVTNTTGGGALTNKTVVWSFYRSSTDNSMFLAGIHAGTNFNPSVPLSGDTRFGTDVTPFIGSDIEILIQRSNNFQQIFVNGFKAKDYPLSDANSTGSVFAPYFVIGQLHDAGQYSHPQAPIYGVAYHQKAFSTDEVNQGVPWARKGGTNAVLMWDFSGASLASGVMDLSGNGVNGTVQQIGATAPEFGTSDDFTFSAGSNMTITRTGKKSWTFSSSGGGGLSDGDKGDITVSGSGSTLTIDADAVALTTDTTGNFVATVAGTANEVSVSGSGSENAAVTLSLPSTVDLGGKTSFEVPNGASPTVDAFGEIAADNDAWAASRGAIVAYDGTASTRLVGVLSSDTPSNGQVPVWNTGGTITWETQSGSGTAISTNGGNTAGLPVVIHGDASFGTTNSLTISNLTVDVLTLTSPIDSSSITNAMATDAEVAAGYQPLDADLTDLADGSLTGSKVGSGIDDDNVAIDDADGVFTATTLGSALEELNDSINAGAPNGTGAKVHWSQLLGVPGGFADGSDDGAGGASITNLNDLGDVDGATPSTNSLMVYTGTTWTKTNSPTISGTLSIEGTNSATLDMGDAQSTPKFATLAAPTAIQTNYQIVLPSNAIPGFVQASSLTATSLVLNPVASTGSGSVVLSAGPTLTGDPTAPTQSLGDSDTSLATTAFAKSQAFYNETNAVAKHATLVSVEAEFIGSGSSSLELVGGSSSGSLSTSSGETSHPGIATISTSTSATGNAYYYGTSSGLSLSNGAAGITWIIKTPSALADATETYSMRFGLNDSTSADAANGVYFRYTTNSANWIAVVREASSETSADTGLSVGASTWYKLTAVINSDATAAFFYTNGTLACSITNANVPGGTSYTRQMAHITKSAGTTARIVGIDYFKFWKEVNR